MRRKRLKPLARCACRLWLVKYSEANHGLNGWLENDQYIDEVELPSELILTLLQRWLRDVHKIEVIVAPKFYGDGSYWYCFECLKIVINDIETLKEIFKGIFNLYKTYEEALEAGLLEGLKLIESE